eukprot:8622127-Pyramimonas_sp.AAC.1
MATSASARPSDDVRTRPPHPIQRLVAPHGLHRRTQRRRWHASAPPSTARRKLHRMPQWRRSHAPAPPNTALPGPIGSSTEGPSGDVRMRPPHPIQHLGAP